PGGGRLRGGRGRETTGEQDRKGVPQHRTTPGSNSVRVRPAPRLERRLRDRDLLPSRFAGAVVFPPRNPAPARERAPEAQRIPENTWILLPPPHVMTRRPPVSG